MIVYQYREGDFVYVGPAEVEDSPFIPPYHTSEPPPERDGCYAVMRGGWVLVEGEPPAPPPPPEPTPPIDYAAVIRGERDAILALSDWRVLRAIETGIPLEAEWSAYRQALRDVPQQDGFPEEVIWPEAPSFLG